MGRKFLNDKVLLHEWRDRLHNILGHIASTRKGQGMAHGWVVAGRQNQTVFGEHVPFKQTMEKMMK